MTRKALIALLLPCAAAVLAGEMRMDDWAKMPTSRHVFSMSCKVTAVNGDLSSPEGRAKAIDWWRKHGFTKLWLESYRHGESVPTERLVEERDAFRQAGFEVCGMITPTSLSEPKPGEKRRKFWVTCWSDPKARDRIRAETARAAKVFDTVIIDDFLFSACGDKCALCKAGKAARGLDDWGEYRRELMYEVCEKDILPTVKAANPKAHFIIKYPCWWRDYERHGYSPARQAKLFGECWVGTETRDANPDPIQACWIMAWMDKIAEGRCGGGWYDPLDCGPEKFVEQAYYTILGGAKESLVHCYDYLIADNPGVMYENSSRAHACRAEFERRLADIRRLADLLQGAERGPFAMGADGVSTHQFRKGGKAFTVRVNTTGGSVAGLPPHGVECAEAKVPAALPPAAEKIALPALPAPGLIDGELTEPSWKKACRTGDFFPLDPSGKVTEQTEGFLFCDAENLYVGARMRFEDYSAHEKWATSTQKPFKGDSIEVFIDPGDTGSYAQIIVGESGGVIFSQGLCAPISVAVQLHEKDWTMEAKIPYASIKLLGSVFSKSWRVNIARNNRSRKELSTWSRLSGGGFHEVAAFNTVTGIPADLAEIRKEQALAAKGDFDMDTDHLVYTTQDVVRATLDFVYDKSMKGFRATASIMDETGRAVAESSVSPVAFHVDFAIPARELPDGRYNLAISLVDSEGNAVKSGETAFWKIPPMPPNPDKWEIKNGCVYHNGEFFFPVTTSLVNWDCSCTSREDALSKFDALFSELQNCGFNCINLVSENYPDEDSEAYAKCKLPWPWARRKFETCKAAGITFDDYCRVSARHGVWLIVRSPYLERVVSPYSKGCLVDHLRRLRTKPNVFCWYMSDEKDGRPEYNMMLKRFYKDIDPTRITWVNVINAVMQHIDTADVISTDPYPVPNNRLSMVATHGDRLLHATEGRPGQTRWLILQMFGGEGNWTRPPTPDEMKCMGMLAVNHGATGLGFFTWTPHRLRGTKRQHAGSMAAMKELTAVLRRHAPALCQGKVAFRGRIAGLDVLAVEHEGRKVMSVVNDTAGDASSVEVSVPGFGNATVDIPRYGFKIIGL